MKIVFFGTPEWAVPSLQALLASPAEVATVVCNPDRPAGRGMKLASPPVKRVAEEAGLPVMQPDKARDPAFISSVAALDPDVCVVVAYGKILPQELLDVAPHGFVNVHFSLLPEYRGAAPVQRAIMDGKSVTGVSIMVLTAGMDEGPVLAQRETVVAPEESAADVGERLARSGAELLAETLPAYVEGRVRPVEQDHERATYAPKLTTEEAAIRWELPRKAVQDHARALDPAPGAWTLLEDDRLKIFRVAAADDELRPGEVARHEGLFVGCGDGAVELLDVQLAGRKRMTGRELERGLKPGTLRIGSGSI